MSSSPGTLPLGTSIVVPTRARPRYLEVTLASILPQARDLATEVLVIADGPDPTVAEIAARHGTRLLTLPATRGLNAARNAAFAATDTPLLAFVDDDVEAPHGWLEALLAGAANTPDRDVFGGPIRPRLEGCAPRSCGREMAPITALDLGSQDRDVQFVWGANMAIRRRAYERVGAFDETISVRGDEEEWQRRYAALGGKVRYLARAGLYHRRAPEDSNLRALTQAAYVHGRAARRYDQRKGTAPAIHRELRTLAGCAWHTARRRCAFGIVFGAHTAGRLREAVAGSR
ncbi:MAG: glycosyltransferase family 2 protein [Solirubrobacterales bacterium]|nr:glycosyltransferase family 2 protein [Solirubrobacterales bacterium]